MRNSWGDGWGSGVVLNGIPRPGYGLMAYGELDPEMQELVPEAAPVPPPPVPGRTYFFLPEGSNVVPISTVPNVEVIRIMTNAFLTVEETQVTQGQAAHLKGRVARVDNGQPVPGGQVVLDVGAGVIRQTLDLVNGGFEADVVMDQLGVLNASFEYRGFEQAG